MEQLNGATIFWFMAQGLLVSYLFKLAFGREGTNMTNNLIGGTAGSVLMGSFSIIAGIGGSMLYAFLGNLTVLFIANVFHQHHVEDIAGHVDQEILIKDNKKE